MTRKLGNEFKHVQLEGYGNINELYEQDSQLHAQIDQSWHLAVKNWQLHKVIIGNQKIHIGAIYHSSNRGMIARAKLNGITGAKSCAAGMEITKDDLRNIFTQHEILKGI